MEPTPQRLPSDPTPAQLAQRAKEARYLHLRMKERGESKRREVRDAIVSLLRERGTITTAMVQALIGTSMAVAVNRFRELVSAGIVEKRSEGNMTAYALADSGDEPEIDLPSNDALFQSVTGRPFRVA